jgi:hypothetical protein
MFMNLLTPEPTAELPFQRPGFGLLCNPTGLMGAKVQLAQDLWSQRHAVSC